MKARLLYEEEAKRFSEWERATKQHLLEAK